MINRSLPRLAPSPVGSKLNQCENFSLCYLARYADNSIPARVVESFTRAWGIGNLNRVAAVPDGRPGYVVATWPDAGLTRITVAIEGARTASQLRTFFGAYSSAPYPPFPGRVLAAYAAHADAIYTELMANATFMVNFNRANVQVTFTGFSLGAAIAELLATKFQENFIRKSYQLSKWASPRVGNATWANFERRVFNRGNFYLINDPIHLHPYQTMANISTRDLVWVFPTHAYAQNTPHTVYTMSGERASTPLADSATAFARSCISAVGALTPENIWYYHQMEAYRLMLFNDCENGNPATCLEAHYRFRFLEYDDDNNWWANYEIGQETFEGLTQLSAPPPPDTIVPQEPAADERRLEQANIHTLRQNPVATPQDNFNREPVPAGLWRPRRTRDF